MNENLKKALEYMFYFAHCSDDIPENESYYKKKNWFHKHSWTEKSEEEYVKWLSEYLKKNWRGIAEHKPTSKKIRDKVAQEFVGNYGFKTKPVTIEDFTELIPDGQLEDILSKRQLEEWAKWAMGSTRSLHGIYRWDVEDFLRGNKNWD